MHFWLYHWLTNWDQSQIDIPILLDLPISRLDRLKVVGLQLHDFNCAKWKEYIG